MNDIHLQEFTGTSFLGISQDNPVVIDFTENKSKGVTVLKGDQGTRKTSTDQEMMRCL